MEGGQAPASIVIMPQLGPYWSDPTPVFSLGILGIGGSLFWRAVSDLVMMVWVVVVYSAAIELKVGVEVLYERCLVIDAALWLGSGQGIKQCASAGNRRRVDANIFQTITLAISSY